ncbi:uncharacterized protein [Nicotiana sylvestris]|uniref:uncharacterized protein n=1 Tax=Nicotiana sylvestris TaxID=4096 RepID=UPI00388CE357
MTNDYLGFVLALLIDNQPDAFVKAHVGAIKVAPRKLNVFKIKQRHSEMLREFVSQLQMERMELPTVFDDWAMHAFMQVLNERSSIAYRQLKQNLIEYPAVTWSDVHNRYRSKIRVENDQLGAPSGSVYLNRFAVKPSRDTDQEPRFNKERYQPYADRKNSGPSRNIPRSDRRNDRGQSSRGLMRKRGFEKHSDPTEAPRLSEYNFSVDASGIVSGIGRIKDTKRPRPIQTDPSQRNPNLMCKYHGTHGYRTEDSRQLREEVARLFNEGHLREFLSDRAKNHFRERDTRKTEQEKPQHVIHMNIGGVDVPQRPIFKRTKLSITREKWIRGYVPEDILSFCDEEAEGISQPNNDALVISILLNKIQVKHVLVDLGSSTNIIRSRVVE